MEMHDVPQNTNKTAPPYEKASYGCEENANDEEGWKHGFGGEDRLPCLQSLLLEGSIYESCGQRLGTALLPGCWDSLAGLFQPPFCFCCTDAESGSPLSLSSCWGRLRLKMAMTVGGKE